MLFSFTSFASGFFGVRYDSLLIQLLGLRVFSVVVKDVDGVGGVDRVDVVGVVAGGEVDGDVGVEA